MINLLDILSPKAVKVPLEAGEKEAAIDELIDLLRDRRLIQDAKALKRAVWEREQQRSTGIGEGLAIPHGKCTCSESLVMAVGRPAEPVEFGAIDRKPVRLIVLLASPPSRTSDHIQALGKISRLMSRPEFRDAAYHAESPEELFRLFEDAEAAANRTA